MFEERYGRGGTVSAPVACKPDPGQTQFRPNDGLQSTIVASFEDLQTTARSIVQSESLIIRWGYRWGKGVRL